MALALLAVPAVARGQDYDVSAGWGGGYISFAPFVEKGAATPKDIGIGGTWVALLQAETWQLQRWVGLRLGGFYSQGKLAYPTVEKTTDVFGAEVAGLLRIIPPAPGRMASAYLIAGGGMMWFKLGEGPTIPIAGTETVTYDDDDRRQLALLGGGGFEIMTGLQVFDGQIGMRFEGVDQAALGGPLRVVDGPDPKMTHNLRFSVTLFSGVPSFF